jgi:hypothetical protein
MKEIGDHDPRLIRANEPQHQLFRPLVECVEWQRTEKNILHAGVLFVIPSEA